MGHKNGPHRGGVDSRKIALRDALRVYVWQHLNKYPELWFSEPDLARVIHEQYIGGGRPGSWGTLHYGRSNAIHKVLCWLEARGEAERKQGERGRQWQAR